MSFFAPWMLLGFAVAAAPILLHIFRKRTARRVRWGAWLFLAESMRRRKRRILVEDVILLVLRTLAVALAAFAFARPFLPEMHLFGGRGSSRDVVLVIDTSGSMGLRRADGRTAFDVALEEARDLVRRSPRGTAFGVVTDRILTVTPFSDKKEVFAVLDKISCTSGTLDVPKALALSAEVLAGGNNPGKETIVFGDGQAWGWNVEDEDAWQLVERLFARFKVRPGVVWRTLDRPESVRNAALESVVPSRRIFGTDRPVAFAATVLNSGSEPVDPGELSFFVDGVLKVRQSVGQIMPGLSKTISFEHRFEKIGVHEIVTSLEAEDDVMADNVITNPVSVIDRLNVALVNGHPEQPGYEGPTAFLSAALKPDAADSTNACIMLPRTMRARELEKENALSGVAVAVLADVPFLPPDAATNLARHVHSGGGLLVLPEDRARTEWYTNWSVKAGPVLACAWTNFTSAAGLSFEGASVTGVARFDEAALPKTAEIPHRLSDGSAACVAFPSGKGRVAISAVPFSVVHSALPARPQFVPFVHDLVLSLCATNSVENLVDTRLRAQEADLKGLSEDEVDALKVHVDLSFARLKDDALAAIVGRGFGVEIWRPFAILVLLLLIAETLFARMVDKSRGVAPGRVRRHALRALRAISVLAIVWMLLHLVWVSDVTRAVHRRVALFTDHSLSMTRYDLDAFGATNAVTRFTAATNASRILEGRLGKYDVEPRSFGGETTDFAAALEKTLAEIPAEELAGAVFVTDGRQTSGPDVAAAARGFARRGARISTVVVGNVTNRPDVAIEALRSPDSIFLGDKVRFAATVRADGMDKKKIAVKLFEGEKELESKEFTIDSAAWKREVRFQHDPQAKGVRHYRVVMETPDADVEQANDSWPADVSVSDDRTNVLVVDRRPRWEFRYLRNLFYARDKSVQLQYVLTEPDGLAGQTPQLPSASASRPFGEAEAGSLPKDRDEWLKFDVIVLGDLSPETFGDSVAADLCHCVEERGATVVFVAGEKYLPAAFAKSRLAELFPVAVTDETGRVTAEWKDGAFPFAITPAGRAHPLTKLSDSASENEQIWNRLPDWSAHLTGVTAKPGAETLAFDGDSSALKDPLLVVRHLGRGKVLFLGADETWRLRYRKGDEYHHRFWGNLLKWGAGVKLRDGNAFARVGAENLHYVPGDTVLLAARFRNRDFMAIADANPTMTVTMPDGRKRSMPLAWRPGENGVWEARLENVDQEGEWVVEAESASAKAVLGDAYPDKLETRFAVERGFAPVEYAHLSADDATAREMARLTGGETASLEKMDDLKFDFGEGRGEVTEHVERPLWSSAWVFLALALALVAEWVIRKKGGLA